MRNNPAVRSYFDRYIASYLKYQQALESGADKETLKELAEKVARNKLAWEEIAGKKDGIAGQASGNSAPYYAGEETLQEEEIRKEAPEGETNVPVLPEKEVAGQKVILTCQEIIRTGVSEAGEFLNLAEMYLRSFGNEKSHRMVVTPGPACVLRSFPGGTPLVLEIPAGAFETTGEIEIKKSNRQLPELIAGKTEQVGTPLDFTISGGRLLEDMTVKLPMPDGVEKDEFIATYYTGGKHEPLEATEPESCREKEPDNSIRIKLSRELLSRENKEAGNIRSGTLSFIKVLTKGSAEYKKRRDCGLYIFEDGVWNMLENAGEKLDIPVSLTGEVMIIHGTFSELERFNRLAYSLYKNGYNVFGFNYDYFRSIEENGKKFKEMLERLAEVRGSTFSLIAHSMGGLVARQAIKNGAYRVIDRLVLLSTPNNGAKGVYELQTTLLGYELPPLSFVNCWPAGIQQLLRSTSGGAMLFRGLNEGRGEVPVDYYGIIHEEDEWVDISSWGIFMKDGGHEKTRNGCWSVKKGNCFILTGKDYKNTPHPADAHGSSHSSEKAIEKIMEFLR